MQQQNVSDDASGVVVVALKTIKELAPKVAQDFHDHDEAWKAERAATQALVREVIELVRPALRAISGPICTSWRLPDGQRNAGTTYFSSRGVRVCGAVPKKVKFDTDAQEGEICGSAVYLLEDGQFAWLFGKGQWSKIAGTTDWWKADVDVGGDEDNIFGGSIFDFDLEEFVQSLESALRKQELRTEAIEKTRARAAKLQALAVLVRG